VADLVRALGGGWNGAMDESATQKP